MFLKNGDYLRASDIVFISQVQTLHGRHQWDTTLTKKLITPDRYLIKIRLSGHEIALEYGNKDDALEDYNNIFIRLQKD